MMTRREIIAGCSMGFAGFCLPNVTSANPIKSMLGISRIGAGEESDVPTAANYVQDGLIAIYDGIENVGWRQHSSTTTTWVNLVNGQWNGTIGSLCTINSDSVGFTGTKSANDAVRLGNAWFGKPTSYTCEVVFIKDGASYNTSWVPFGGREGGRYNGFTFWGSSGRWHLGINEIDTGYGFYFGKGSAMSQGVIHQTSVKVGESGVSCWIDGTKYIKTTNASTAFWGGATMICYIGSESWQPTEYNMNGRVFCVRVYNRDLTDEEISYNYTIDLERFMR